MVSDVVDQDKVFFHGPWSFSHFVSQGVAWLFLHFVFLERKREKGEENTESRSVRKIMRYNEGNFGFYRGNYRIKYIFFLI